MEKYAKKILSWILIFALIFGQLSAPITVLAQEATASAQTSDAPEATDSASQTDPQPSPTPIATASATPSATPTPTPTETPTLVSIASPSATPAAEAFREPITNKVTEKAGEGRDKKWVEGEVIVKFKKDKTNLRTTLGDIKASAFESKHGLKQVDEIKDLNITVQKDDKPTQQLISELESDPEVEYVEPNYYLKPRSLPNDPDFEKLWALHNTGQNIVGTGGTSDADIDAPEAWDVEDSSQPDVIVAVIDSGVNYHHPDLKGNMWDGASCKDENNNSISGGCPNHGWDFENNDNNPIDDDGHGSHIAGTIAAVQNNSKGISGLSSKNNIKIMALKFGYTHTTVANEIRAISFAKNNGAKVINASYGGWAPSQAEKDAIASFPGLFVAAAGNTDTDNDVTGDTPSGYDNENIIAVAATDNKDNLADFSSYGKNLVDVGAPGVNIYSTIFETSFSELNKQSFENVTPPNIPSGFTKTGDWGTSNAGPVYGNVLYGDATHYPYIPNANSLFTSPKFNMSSNSATQIDFVTVCDTQKSPTGAYTDYMSLEASSDGTNFTRLTRWDEIDLPAIPGVTTHTGGYLYVDIPASYLTPNFTYRFRWITNGDNDTGSLGGGCFIDDVRLATVTAGGEKYEYMDGTSMATPHVVGEAAMILSYKPSLTTSQVKDTILNSGDPLPALAGKTVSGKRINLNNALRYVPQSSNADLSNLTISTGTLSPSFSPSIASYSAQVANNVNTIKVTPTVSDSKSSVKVNGVNVISTTPSADISLNLGNNLITIVVTAENQTTKTYTINVVRLADTTAPIITITSPAVNARVSGISILQFTVNETAEVKCSLDNHVFKNCSSGDTFASLDLFNNFIDGPFTVYMQAQDPAGNIGTLDRGFIKDTYIPLSPGTPTAQAGPMINAQEYASGFLVVVPLAPDAEKGDLLKVYLNTDYQFISHPLTTQDVNSSKYSFAVGSPSLGEDGTKQFRAQITDDLGRTSAFSDPLTLTLDTQAPQSPIITSVADDNKINALEKQQVKVQGTTEANAWVKLSLTDQISTQSAIVKLTNNNTNYNIVVDSTDLNDGNILTIVSAEDEAGNGSASSFKTVLKDTSFPTLTYVSISSNNANSTKAKLGDTITLQFSASEDLGKDPQVSIHESIITSSKSGNIYKASRVVESTDNEMKATFEINYEDRAGNKGTRVNTTTDQSSVTIDKTAPSLQQITAITSPTNNNTPDLTFSSTEAGIISYFGGCSSSQTVASLGNNTITFNPLANGTYDNCTIVVTDEASNTSQVLKVNTFTVDTVAPSGILVINNSNKYTNSTKLTLTLTNASADISKVEIAEGATGSFGDSVTYSGPISYTLQDGAEGQKVVRIRLTDAASNTSGEFSDTIILDTIAPTISNIILNNKTTSNNFYVENGDILELSATIADTNLADIISSDIKANLSSVGGNSQTNPTSFDQTSGIAIWKNIVVSSTTEGFIRISVDAKDQAGNIATAVTKTIEADNSIPQAKADYFTTSKNTPILISQSLVLVNDIDSSGDILLFSGFKEALKGTISIVGSDALFTPQANFIGTGQISYTITDGIHTSLGTIYIIVTPDLKENEKTLQPVTELGGQNNKVVVVDVPFESTINVSSDAVNATLDLSNVVTSLEIEKTAALTGKINVNVNSSIGNLNLQLPETVSISGPVSWNGAIKIPTSLDNSTFTATPSAGMEATTTAVIEVGSEDAKLILSKAARLVIPGKKGHLTAYIQVGKVTSITTICGSDNQASADQQLPASGECKIDVGSDLVIWTKHFTRFVTYTETALPTAGGSTGGSPSSSSGALTCTDAKPASAPRLVSAVPSGANEVTLTWSKASDPVTYYLVAYGLEKGKMQFGNPNVGDKNTTTFTVKGLSGGTTYYFKIRAGNHCMPGEYSNEIAIKAYGDKISKSAEGFKKGVLSTSKIEPAKPTPAPSGAKPASNVLNVIKDFLLKLLSNLQSLSYLPSLRRTHPGSG